MIFVIDDDEVVRDSLKVLLETRDFIVRDFASCREFLHHKDGVHAGCLILDIHMPDMTGIDLLRLLREKGDAIPVILITGRRDATIRAQAEALGAVAFLDKPVAFPQLFAAIQQAVASSQA
ncbi:MAG: response regulator [Proteobacteria bacterium]|nr:response regulator [Pseudomonadota bacterium]